MWHACITESWFDSKNGTFSSAIKKAGYKLHHAYRENKRGGGVAILYKKCLSVKERNASTVEFSSFEYAYITLHLKNKRKLLIICVYRKQEISFANFIEEFSCLMDKTLYMGDMVMVLGDFNVWIEIDDNQETRKFDADEFVQAVSENKGTDSQEWSHT